MNTMSLRSSAASALLALLACAPLSGCLATGTGGHEPEIDEPTAEAEQRVVTGGGTFFYATTQTTDGVAGGENAKLEVKVGAWPTPKAIAINGVYACTRVAALVGDSYSIQNSFQSDTLTIATSSPKSTTALIVAPDYPAVATFVCPKSDKPTTHAVQYDAYIDYKLKGIETCYNHKLEVVSQKQWETDESTSIHVEETVDCQVPAAPPPKAPAPVPPSGEEN